MDRHEHIFATPAEETKRVQIWMLEEFMAEESSSELEYPLVREAEDGYTTLSLCKSSVGLLVATPRQRVWGIRGLCIWPQLHSCYWLQPICLWLAFFI